VSLHSTGVQTRTSIIAGLRDLAAFLETNPAVPVSEYGWTLDIPQALSNNTETDHQQRAEVDRVAELLDVQPSTSLGGHYAASRAFGPVVYQIVHVPAQEMAEYYAWHSYRDNIRLDPADQDEDQDARAA
jgi:hypothetical protein